MIFFLHDVKQFSLDRFIFKMGGLLSFILQKRFSILLLKYKKIQRDGAQCAQRVIFWYKSSFFNI